MSMNLEKWDEELSALENAFAGLYKQNRTILGSSSEDTELAEKLAHFNRILAQSHERLAQIEMGGQRAQLMEGKGKFTVIWAEAFAQKLQLYLKNIVQVKYIVILLNVLHVRLKPKEHLGDYRIEHKSFLEMIKTRLQIKQQNKELEKEVKNLEKVIRGMWREDNYRDVVLANTRSLAPNYQGTLKGKRIVANDMTLALEHFFAGIAYQARRQKFGSHSMAGLYHEYVKKGQEVSKMAYALAEKSGKEKRHAWELGYTLPQAERRQLLKEFMKLEQVQTQILGSLPSHLQRNLPKPALKVMQNLPKKARYKEEFLARIGAE